jgi:endopolyphosphatase
MGCGSFHSPHSTMTHWQGLTSAPKCRSCASHAWLIVTTSSDLLQFYFLQADDLELWEDPQISGNKGLFDTIIDNFSYIPKASKIDYNNYAVVNVAPSVVPNPYLPTFRIFSYNITGMKTVAQAINSTGRLRTTKNRTPKHPRGGKAGNKEKLCKKKEYKDTWKCRLREPWNADEEAPSRSNTLWSPLGYTQVRGHISSSSGLLIIR